MHAYRHTDTITHSLTHSLALSHIHTPHKKNLQIQKRTCSKNHKKRITYRRTQMQGRTTQSVLQKTRDKSQRFATSCRKPTNFCSSVKMRSARVVCVCVCVYACSAAHTHTHTRERARPHTHTRLTRICSFTRFFFLLECSRLLECSLFLDCVLLQVRTLLAVQRAPLQTPD